MNISRMDFAKGYYVALLAAGLLASPFLVNGVLMPAVHSDFVVWYAASFGLVREGLSFGTLYDLFAFDDLLRRATGEPGIAGLPYFYPPTFGLLFYPAAFVSLETAYYCFAAINVASIFLACRVMGAKSLDALLITFTPMAIACIAMGQLAGLLVLGMTVGYRLLGSKPFWAGVVFALMTFKPHLAVVIPVILLAGRHWRAIAGLAVGTGVFALLSALAFGFEAWWAFLFNGETALAVIRSGHFPFKVVFSNYTFFRALGLGDAPSLALQTLLAVAALGITYCYWRPGHRAFDKVTALAVSSLMISPHVMMSDCALLVAPMALWFATRPANSGKIALLLGLALLFWPLGGVLLAEFVLMVNPYPLIYWAILLLLLAPLLRPRTAGQSAVQ